MKRSEIKLPGIYINCKTQDFIGQILSGEKVIETRNKPTLDPFIGKSVYLVRTGCGAATVCGTAFIQGRWMFDEGSFRFFEAQHLIEEGSPYDIRPGQYKYGYVLTDVVRFPE